MDGVFTRRGGAQPDRAWVDALDRQAFSRADKQNRSHHARTTAQSADLDAPVREHSLYVRGCLESMDCVGVAVSRLK